MLLFYLFLFFITWIQLKMTNLFDKKQSIMKLQITFILLTIIALTAYTNQTKSDENFVSYTVNPKKANVKLYWKNDKGEVLNNFKKMKSFIEEKNEKLLFAMNGGMFHRNYSPVGLYIENSKMIRKLNNSSGKGNFYLKPNGTFYITSENIANICQTSKFVYNDNIKYATQSGPMLVINNKIHSAFTKGSKHLNIRNGVGILPNNELFFAMSTEKISLYDFAEYFKNKGCKNALFLDGYVSKIYYPAENWKQTNGNFGVMIGVTK